MDRPGPDAPRRPTRCSSCRGGLSVNLEELRDYVDEIEAAPLNALLDQASPDVRAALKRSLDARGTDAATRGCCSTPRRRRPARGGEMRRPRARRGCRRRSHLRRQPQHQLHQYLLRRLPVLRLQAPALGIRRLRPFRRDHARQGRRRASRAAPPRSACRAASIPRCRPSSIATCWSRSRPLSRDPHPRFLADGDHVRRAAHADGLSRVHRDAARGGPRLDSRHRGRNPRRRACAKS